MLAHGETEYGHVDVIPTEGVAAVGQRKPLAEEADGRVIAASAAVCGERYLVRPVAVDDVLAELSSTIEHAVTGSWSPPPLTQLTGRGNQGVRRAGGRRYAL